MFPPPVELQHVAVFVGGGGGQEQEQRKPSHRDVRNTADGVVNRRQDRHFINRLNGMGESYKTVTREELRELPEIPMGQPSRNILWIATGELHEDTGYSLIEIYGTDADGNVAGAYTRSADAFEIATGVQLECVAGCRGTAIFSHGAEFTCVGSSHTATIKRIVNGREEPGLLDRLQQLADAVTHAAVTAINDQQDP